MRPLSLAVRAFGPYAGEQLFDFTQLGGVNFLLIHGPTGAGKTSVLDAICFALYGENSGDERKAAMVRSDHADPAVATEVELAFQLGEARYRVRRAPEQERPRKRGEGTTTQKPQATLWALGAGAEPVVLATKWSEVTERIEALLNFRADEFRQVVVLPQGQFRRLLLAPSSEREEILERLFRTELYRRIEEDLKESRRQLEEERRQLVERRQFVLDEAAVAGVEELGERVAAAMATLAAAGERLGIARTGEAAAELLLREAEKASAAHTELALATRGLQALELECAAVEERERTVAHARSAALLRPVHESREGRSKEATAAAAARDGAAAAMRVAVENLDRATHALAAEEARQEERRIADERVRELAALGPLAGELAGARELLEAAERHFADTTGARGWTEGELKLLSGDHEIAVRELRACETIVAEAETRRLTLSHLDDLLLVRADLQGLRGRHAEEIERQNDVSALLVARAESAASARRGLAALEHAWSHGQAAILASDLVDGEPCPVCGSREHPLPALAREQLPTRGDIDTKREECERHNEERAKLEKRASEIAVASAELATRIAEREAKLAEWLSRPIEELDARRAEAHARADEVASAEQRRSALAERIETLGTQMQENEEELAKLRTAVERAAENRARALERASQLEEQVPDVLRAPGAVDAALGEARARLGVLTKDLDAAVDGVRSAELELAKATTALRGLEDEANKAALAAAKEAERFEAALVERGFRDEAEYLDACRSAAEMDVLEADTTRFRQAFSAARDRLERARAAAAGLATPELEKLRAEHLRARELLESAIAAETSAKSACERLQRASEQLAEASGRLAAIDQRYAVLGRVADVVAGKNAAGIPFQRFVLATLLDEVLAAASERLRIMSNNRYCLERCRDRGSRRTTTGLELEVYDAYTGVARPVATLSGGESFLASLALALGLADVVQSHAGGVRLDTIFVDEGFGTLDSEALDLAMRALEDLQKGGRLVAVISHVPELRERIPARLEVIPGRGGSRARFVLP